MAIFTLKDAYFSIGGVNLSSYVTSITVDTGVETTDITAMGSSTRLSDAGLSTWSMSVDLLQDFGSGGPDETIAGLTNRKGAIEIRPVNTTVSATNPKWTGTGVVEAYNPVSGSVGDQATCSLSITANTALTRATS